MADCLEIEVICDRCNGRVRLTFTSDETPREGRLAVWTCPHCERIHKIPVFGRVLKSEKRSALA